MLKLSNKKKINNANLLKWSKPKNIKTVNTENVEPVQNAKMLNQLRPKILKRSKLKKI